MVFPSSGKGKGSRDRSIKATKKKKKKKKKKKRFLDDNEFLREFISGWSGIVFPVGRIGRDLSGNGETGESRCIACHKRGRIERYNRIKSSIVFSYVRIRLVRLCYCLSLFPSYRNAGFAFWEWLKQFGGV